MRVRRAARERSRTEELLAVVVHVDDRHPRRMPIRWRENPLAIPVPSSNGQTRPYQSQISSARRSPGNIGRAPPIATNLATPRSAFPRRCTLRMLCCR